MEKIKLTIHSDQSEDIITDISSKIGIDLFDIPNSKNLVYNDKEYIFSISNSSTLPTKIYINDEIFEVEILEYFSNKICFQTKNNTRPFLHSFGAVKIGIEFDEQVLVSPSIKVLVSSNGINYNVLNMVQYIYDNCEKYLYEEHKYSSVSTGIKENKIISLEAKIAYMKKILDAYKAVYPLLKFNPYSKLKKTEDIGSFDKLKTVTANTMKYIATHTDELVAVNYNTGIRYNRMFYQPTKVLVEYNKISLYTYENKVILGFLHKIVDQIDDIVNDIKNHFYVPDNVIVAEGYIDSTYKIFSSSIKRLNNYIIQLSEYKEELRHIYFYYKQILGDNEIIIDSIPNYTAVFRSVNAYRQIYQVIYDWFTCGNYDLGKDELLLSFISTSKIYEYYCLIKILNYIDKNLNMKLMPPQKKMYNVSNKYYTNTRYNNTFTFENDRLQLTLFFQPVIYDNDLAANDIHLFRNTSFCCSNNTEEFKGKLYTPDYIIKVQYDDFSEYYIMDAKFSSSNNIRKYQLQNMVFKYIFSLSTLKENTRLSGLYILSGKTVDNDKADVVHDIAYRIGKKVNPFAEIMVISGNNTNDYSVIEEIFNNIIK